ncbi:MAG TPA: LysR family transcriptional regulator [Sphingobium sp.]|nr:LysR family transcriptional regulator [Sphingobium sp.]
MSAWDGIDEFIAVASAGSFTHAGRALGVSTAHVSRAIMALEQQVQAQLFHRTTRSVRLTDTGRMFFDRCERLVQERDEAIALISERGEPQGELRVTCPTAMGERFIAPILRRFAMPYSRLNLSINLSNRLIDLVAEGYDLAIRTGVVSDPRLIAERIATRRLLTCAAPSYLARAGTPRTIEDLDHHQCLTGTSTTWHFQQGEQELLFRPKGRFRCNSGHAVIEACIAGLGICQLPDFYILPFLQPGMVELILDDHRPAHEPIWAVYPQRRHLVPKVHQAVACLKQELGSAMNSRQE